MSEVEIWQRLMDETVHAAKEKADYNPGVNQAPGAGTEGDDPLGIKYAGLGPLAFVLNEAMDSRVVSGADRDSLVEQVAQAAGDAVAVTDVTDTLADKVTCPPVELLQAFSSTLGIDYEIIQDAAQRGGCTNYGPIPSAPPGF